MNTNVQGNSTGNSSKPRNLPVTLTSSKVARQHVHLVYDEIANHFHQTRVWMWPKVIEFIESLPSQSTVLDVGCGYNEFKGKIKNLTGIDPYNFHADWKIALKDYLDSEYLN